MSGRECRYGIPFLFIGNGVIYIILKFGGESKRRDRTILTPPRRFIWRKERRVGN